MATTKTAKQDTATTKVSFSPMPASGIGRVVTGTAPGGQLKDLASYTGIDAATLIAACFVAPSATQPALVLNNGKRVKANAPSNGRCATTHDNYTSAQLVNAALSAGPCTKATLHNLCCLFNAHTGMVPWLVGKNKSALVASDAPTKGATKAALVKALASNDALTKYASQHYVGVLAS